jgi:hypothetical protein
VPKFVPSGVGGALAGAFRFWWCRRDLPRLEVDAVPGELKLLFSAQASVDCKANARVKLAT